MNLGNPLNRTQTLVLFMEVSSGGSNKRVAAVAVVVLIAVALVAYYASTLQGTGKGSSQLSTLQSEVNSLQQANQALQAQLSSTSSNTGNSSATAEGIYSTASPSVVTVQGYELITQNTFFGPVTSIASIQGSGFAVSYQNSSYVVTNNHVVNGVQNITVTFSNGDSYPATVKGTDAIRDLAVLDVNAPSSEFHPLTLLNTTYGVTVGESVYAIGSPFGLSGSLTVGVVSQVGRTITESTSSQVTIPDIIQFSAAINPGNSGGPLLDSRGVVIGITTAAVSSSQGLGFAIPATTISRELSSLITSGTYKVHPYLGLNVSDDMTYQLARATNSSVTYGVLVESVVAGGPLANAGVRGGTSTVTVEGQTYRVGGDIITSVNGTKVVDMDALASYLEENAVAGQTVQLGIVRGGIQMTIPVVLGSVSGS
jgi:S1-C subfamily serine protease